MNEYKQVLSIRQPWAWLILNWGKDVENRNWKTEKRGETFIHASKTIDQDAVEYFKTEHNIPFPAQFQTGGIVGKVNIVDCVDSYWSWWFEGKYGLVLENPETVEFFPCNGQLGFFSRNNI